MCTKEKIFIEEVQFHMIYIHKNFESKISDGVSINCKDIESVGVEILTTQRQNKTIWKHFLMFFKQNQTLP